MPGIVVAIDGPSGVGKSSVAAALAARLGLPFLETGAMYRAVGWQVLQAGIDPEDQSAVAGLVEMLDLEVVEGPDGAVEIRLSGEPLGEEIRDPVVSEVTSRISSYAQVRAKMVARQREFAQRRGAVLEGRDIGTKVFPNTPYKFFLTAPEAIRVARRLRQLNESGGRSLDARELAVEIQERDRRDSSRAVSPLTQDPSYHLIDTSIQSVDEIVEQMVAMIRA